MTIEDLEREVARAQAELSAGEPVAELVQGLRGRARWYDDAHPGTVKTPQVLREAADALERLAARAEAAEADNARLRAQLKTSAEASAASRHSLPLTPKDPSIDGYPREDSERRMLAHAALEQKI